ncbi:MAG TPA: TetR/AcrR family transcriptional regulator [Ktedonobacteraceae bacterium]|jgi:AcrR family transcriptional regulator|nr:TetR/AcrR family transcriptional regulator [Ktedonobacteraceae bacterium]
MKMRHKTEILTIAGELFSERGYHGTSMRELGRALDMKSASLYSHVKSKEELLWEIINHTANRFLEHARSVPVDISPEQQIASLSRGHLELIAQNLHYATVFFHEWKYLEAPLHDRIKAQSEEYEAFFYRAIEQGVQQGAFHITDIHLAVRFVLSSLNWTYQWFEPEGDLSLERLAEHYIALILNALTGEP